MFRFRHFVVGPYLEHGSDVLSVQVQKEVTGTSYIVIPKRPISKFEFESKREGVETAPVILFGWPRATFELRENNTIVYRGFPSLADSILFPVLAPMRFRSMLARRVSFLRQLASYLAQIKIWLALGSGDAFQILIKWQEDMDVFVPLMVPAVLADEYILDSLLLACPSKSTGDFRDNPDAVIYCSSQAFKADAVQHSIKSFDLSIPIQPQNIFVPTVPSCTICDTFLSSQPLDKHIDDDSQSILRSVYMQMLDENIYFWQSYSDLITAALQSLQRHNHKLATNPNAILRMAPKDITLANIKTL